MLAVARRLAIVGLSWLAVVAASFFLIRAMPGDPVQRFLTHVNIAASSELAAAYRAAWGLEGPLIVQFLHWLTGFLSLEWGVSFSTGAPVFTDLSARLPWSAAIGAGGMAIAVMVGFGLGFYAACDPNGIADRLSRFLAIAGQALPSFAVGLILLWFLAAELQWIRPYSGGTLERLLLPICLVAFFSIGSVSRIVRAAFADVRNAAYFRTALAKGLSRNLALWRHGRRNAALTLIAGIAPELAWIVGGTAVAEIVFGVPGVSERIVQAVDARDYAVLQPYVALVALWIILTLQAAAIMRRALDPRLG